MQDPQQGSAKWIYSWPGGEAEWVASVFKDFKDPNSLSLSKWKTIYDYYDY